MVAFGQAVPKIFASFDSKRTLLLFYINLNFDLGVFSKSITKIYEFNGQYIHYSIPLKITYLLIFISLNLVNALRRYSKVSLYSVRSGIYYINNIATRTYSQPIREKYLSYTDILYIAGFLGLLSIILSLFHGIWSRNNGLINKFLFLAFGLFVLRDTSCYGQFWITPYSELSSIEL